VNPDEQLEIQLGFGPVPSTVEHGCPSGSPEDCGVLVVEFDGNVESLRVPLSVVFEEE